MEIIIKNLEDIPNGDLEWVASIAQQYLGDKIHQIVFWDMAQDLDDYEGGGSVTITTDKARIVGYAYNYDEGLEAITVSLYLDEKEIRDVQKEISKEISLTKAKDNSGKPCFRGRVNIDLYGAIEKVLEVMSKIKSL